jgi:glycosyltransferase involved in cell wall biosynthesis
MTSLTACILTLNEARHISDCISSLHWADEILVFDSLSQDATVALAAQAGAMVRQNPFANYSQQRNAALDVIQTDWVFFVDADERATAAVAAEVQQVVANRPELGWYIPRHNYIFGKLTRGAGWFPDYQARLFKTSAVRYEKEVHEIAVVDGPVGYLQEPLTHYNYDSIAQFHQVQQRYTDFDAGILKQAGIRPKLYTPYTQALRHFRWRYVSHQGYQDGLHGLRLSLFMAYYEWVKYRKLVALWAS